ncbi:hypothetical protein ABZP36_030433 [Zizania latifolia]
MAIGLAEDNNKGDANKATVVIARSALSARQRRMSGRRRVKSKNGAVPFAVSRRDRNMIESASGVMLSFARRPLSAAIPASNLLGTDLFQCPVHHAFVLFSCFLFASVCLKSPHQDAVGIVVRLSLVSELPPSHRLICFGMLSRHRR